jgi:hypothetical protein
MHGIILLKHNYTYEGDIVDGESHGTGHFQYANGDKYRGSCRHDKLDGFGIYTYRSGSNYTGFFSYGKLHGVGTYEDANNIYKGTWRSDKKHGVFHRTNKERHVTYLQKWIKGRLKTKTIIQYIQPLALITTKTNPNKMPKTYQISYKGNNKQCIGCENNSTNCANDGCGHVVMCVECLSKCDTCPICRCPIGNIVKLFIC